MNANETLADAVFAALESHLGEYSGPDSGPAFWSVRKSFAMTAEGLEPGTRVTGLEAIMALYPDSQFQGMYEFGDSSGMQGVLHYILVLKQWDKGESVTPAYNAILEAFPLTSSRVYRQPRPIVTDMAEALTVYIPVLTD